MNVTVENLEKNKVKLQITADVETVNKGLDFAFNKMVKQIDVPGFRKGKVPRKIFEQKFGVEALYDEALNHILPEVYEAAVTEAGIDPVAQPDVEIEEMDNKTGLKLTAEVFVRPEAVLGEYKGQELVETEKYEDVTDVEVDNELDTYRERNAQLIVVEDGEVTEGDTTKIDFEGFKDGEAFAGGKGEDYPLEVGSGSFIPGFEEQVVGMKVGEEKDIELSFPEEYHAEELAGAAVTFKVKVNEIKRKVLPELDDELAKDVSEFETLAELREDVKNKLQIQREAQAKDHKRELALNKAVENADLDIPQPMVETETKQMVKDFENRMKYQGMNLESYLQYSGQNMEQFEDQFKEEAEKRVKSQLILEAIVKAESIEVSEQDIEDEYAIIADMYKKTVDEVKSLLAAQGNIEALEKELAMRKAVDFLMDNNTFIKE